MTYEYKATVVRWVDGDTVDLRVDLGFRMFAETRFRLYGIDTPERGQPGYADATKSAESLAPAGSPVRIETYKDADKYGRWLALVYPIGDYGSIPDVSNQLINLGHGKPYFGGTKS